MSGCLESSIRAFAQHANLPIGMFLRDVNMNEKLCPFAKFASCRDDCALYVSEIDSCAMPLLAKLVRLGLTK